MHAVTIAECSWYDSMQAVLFVLSSNPLWFTAKIFCMQYLQTAPASSSDRRLDPQVPDCNRDVTASICLQLLFARPAARLVEKRRLVATCGHSFVPRSTARSIEAGEAGTRSPCSELR